MSVQDHTSFGGWLWRRIVRTWLREGCLMWAVENRAHYDRSMLRCPSDLTDDEWALVKPSIPRAKQGSNKRTVDVCVVVNGPMSLRSGCIWKHAGHRSCPVPPQPACLLPCCR